MIEINGQKFEYRPDCPYKYDYRKIAQKIAEAGTGEEGRKYQISTLRRLILDDLFFIVFFVLKVPIANCPFVVKVCREVEEGPKDFTLDVWAREHFKSTIITIAETIQFTLANPDAATAIFSYVRPVAKKFLFSIKEIFQNEKILHDCFQDVVFCRLREGSSVVVVGRGVDFTAWFDSQGAEHLRVGVDGGDADRRSTGAPGVRRHID